MGMWRQTMIRLPRIRRQGRALTLGCLVLVAFTSEAAPAQTPDTTNVIYGMHYGTALLMDVAYPDSANGYGVLLLPGTGWHGDGSYDATSLKDRGGPWDHLEGVLAESGYTTFTINYRTAPAFRYPAAVTDARRAVRFVRQHADRFGVVEEPVGAIGGSSGGHLVSLLGVLDGDSLARADRVGKRSAKVQCVVALYAPHDFLAEKLLAGISGQVISSFIGHPPPPPGADSAMVAAWRPAYREASPITHISEGDAEFLLVHGTADQVVPVQQSMRMRDSLARAGIPVAFHRLNGVDHGPMRPDEYRYRERLIPWLDRCLKSDGPAFP